MLPLILEKGSWSGSFENHMRQWGIGHGGFFTQEISFYSYGPLKVADKDLCGRLNIVYDCGSGRGRAPNRELVKSIHAYLDQLEGQKINLLAISHFDKDHINGLEELSTSLTKLGVSVSRIWAPILSPLDKLYLAVEVGDRAGLPESEFLEQIVVDPESMLRELFPEADVQLIAPTDEAVPRTQNLPMDGDWPSLEEAPGLTILSDPRSRKLVVRASSQPNGESIWELCPFVTPSTMRASSAMNAAVRKFIGKSIDKCDIGDLLKIINDKSTLAKFYDLIRADRKRLRSSRVRGKGGGTAPNLSSLCVYSAPVEPYTWCRNRGLGRNRPASNGGKNGPALTPWAVPVAPGWLGTGDGVFATRKEVDALAAALGSSRLDRVGIASAPHHGSRLDSGADLWASMPNVAIVTLEGDHLKGGKGNMHPHSQVLNELKRLGIFEHVATRGNGFEWIDKRHR